MSSKALKMIKTDIVLFFGMQASCMGFLMSGIWQQVWRLFFCQVMSLHVVAKDKAISDIPGIRLLRYLIRMMFRLLFVL